MLKYICLKEEHAKLTLRWRLMPHVTKFMLTDINEDLAEDILDTNIYELIPSGMTRQEQISKFFADLL